MAQERRVKKLQSGQVGKGVATAEEATSNIEHLPQVQEDTASQEDTPGNRRGGGGGRKKLKKLRQKVKAAEAALEAAQRQVAETPTYPMARPAQMRRRHWGLVASFVLMVLAPLAAAVFYLWAVAEDQYISTAGFTVRSQESGGATDILGGLANFAGNSTASDSDILYEFIQSQEMVESVDKTVPLRPHYSQHWPDDWVFSLWPDATLEQMIWYWQRIVGISYDSGSGLIEVQAVAFDPETARDITRAIVTESQTRINELNEQAREDAMRYAREDLDEALEQLKGAREALTSFRTRTRIVDPEADIQGRMGVMNNLQQQLAEALIEYDLLRGTVGENDPRLKKAQQHIDVIRERINIERQTFTSTNTDTGAVGEDYPSLISEFERLTVDLEYAEETYRAALTALEVARDEATRQSRYLATYIKPTQAQESEYPDRPMLAGLAGLFLLLTWSILALIYYSIRDRS
ncbi:sugar transporter [Phaeobacter gallaeciensis]|uniref:sugar transporter n=1 Tax=Phaeobacter gallaeciensis TaxID=60890 RepID=UPI00237FAF9F|nr:sugar transporter [Phaeobacter gallaeciensis]MDE4193160.1 sugar transporter [Phaeobacter gallaeciensis]MDE4201459.1 sugar transporter [Phaeobacter gallaeciensis]MDE4205639.1 sugar transporter [Phaeobacter gallaeciensis]MDE4209755.1 sugar transporter [Phaeobacter gallaeciensis]MDE4218145.1 sugar transporter [Phaeobacter gallaeciensis]